MAEELKDKASADKEGADNTSKVARDMLPGYEIISILGKGAMGVVYKARQISLDRTVAVKVLPRHLAQNEEFLERFYREAKAVAKLRHENIISGIDVAEAGGLHYFVMEHVDGITLYQKMHLEGGIGIPQAASVMAQIARALEYAHSSGIIHRDVKPDNIMLSSEGVAKLCDLGLAKDLTIEGIAATGKAEGTPFYISPEQVLGGADVDHRTDIYSLGATFYHVLSGRPPFTGANVQEIMRKHLDERPAPLREIRPEIPEGYALIIEKMMAREMESRYESMEEALEDIDRVERGEAPLLGRTKSALKTLVVVGVAAALVLAAVIALYFATQSEPIDLGAVSISAPATAPKGTAAGTAAAKTAVLTAKNTAPAVSPEDAARKAESIAARDAYLAAQAYKESNPEDYRGIAARYKAIVDKFPNSPIAPEAKGELEIALKKFDERAQKESAGVAGAVDAALSLNDYASALGVPDAFIKEYAGTKWEAQGRAEKTKVERAFARRMEGGSAQVRRLVKEGRYAEAQTVLDDLKKGALPESRPALDALAKLIEETSRGAAASAAMKEFNAAFYAALELHNLDNASQIVYAAIENPALEMNKKDLEELVAQVEAMKRAKIRLESALASATGKEKFKILDGSEIEGKVASLKDGIVVFKPANKRETVSRGEWEMDTAGLVALADKLSGGKTTADEHYENGLLLLTEGYAVQAEAELAAAEKGGKQISAKIKSALQTAKKTGPDTRAGFLLKIAAEFSKYEEHERAAAYYERILVEYEFTRTVRDRRQQIMDAFRTELDAYYTSQCPALLLKGKVVENKDGNSITLSYAFQDDGEIEDWHLDKNSGKNPFLKHGKGQVEISGRVVLRPLFTGDVTVEFIAAAMTKDALNINLFINDNTRKDGWFFGLGTLRDRNHRDFSVDPPGGKSYPRLMPCELVAQYGDNYAPNRFYYGGNATKATNGVKYRVTAVHAGDKISFSVGGLKLCEFTEQIENDTVGRVGFHAFDSTIVVDKVAVKGALDPAWIKDEVKKLVDEKCNSIVKPPK
jgi:serine/threonine-protein kinase